MNCEDYKLEVEFPNTGKIDLSPFCLKIPLVIGEKDGNSIIKYFTPTNSITLEANGKSDNLVLGAVVSDKICAENPDKELIIDILSNDDIKIMKLDVFVEDVALVISIRNDLLNALKSQILKAISTKDKSKIEKVISEFVSILRVNNVDINNLAAIVDEENVEDLIKLENEYIEFINGIVKRIEKDLDIIVSNTAIKDKK